MRAVLGVLHLLVGGVILVLSITSDLWAQEQTESVTTVVKDPQLGLTIKGNQELPNVLYIIPWKKGPKNEISPIQGRIVDEVYGPVESHVFKRQVNLYRQLMQLKEKPEQ
jgi:hypothetical protein